MKHFGFAEGNLVKAFVVALGFGAVAHAGLGYLPLVGPPPLRMVVAQKTDAAVALVNLSSDTNLFSTLAATEAIQMPVASALVLSGQTNSTDDVQSISLGADNLGVDPFGPPVFTLASPDLLNITPQMLAAYFHPVARGTNAAELAMPVPVIFMPPTVRAPQPSSHAEYIVK
jgi:hypothetical protein